ncbi:hypothetical protein FA95DRAFT_1577105 [Auriscalpium vulgare]|uniref:Uncharacterized protein n=1 Tax=Auriscalpium vulgare TaxID=40419 RepID=A0ACB8R8I3_9AGAM|nr:hypothetical protein FA95DRAFT_1577105 [Auriscalpium vulgare]
MKTRSRVARTRAAVKESKEDTPAVDDEVTGQEKEVEVAKVKKAAPKKRMRMSASRPRSRKARSVDCLATVNLTVTAHPNPGLHNLAFDSASWHYLRSNVCHALTRPLQDPSCRRTCDDEAGEDPDFGTDDDDENDAMAALFEEQDNSSSEEDGDEGEGSDDEGGDDGECCKGCDSDTTPISSVQLKAPHQTCGQAAGNALVTLRQRLQPRHVAGGRYQPPQLFGTFADGVQISAGMYENIPRSRF